MRRRRHDGQSTTPWGRRQRVWRARRRQKNLFQTGCSEAVIFSHTHTKGGGGQHESRMTLRRCSQDSRCWFLRINNDDDAASVGPKEEEMKPADIVVRAGHVAAISDGHVRTGQAPRRQRQRQNARAGGAFASDGSQCCVLWHCDCGATASATLLDWPCLQRGSSADHVTYIGRTVLKGMQRSEWRQRRRNKTTETMARQRNGSSCALHAGWTASSPGWLMGTVQGLE